MRLARVAIPEPPPPGPLPDPPLPDPYYLDPVVPLDRPHPPSFPPQEIAPPMLIPAPVPDSGGLLAPGLAVVGVF